MPYLTLEEITQCLLVISGIIFLVSVAVIIYAISFFLIIRRFCRDILRKPEIARDANGRPIKERI
jgi:hypothetical protein